VRKFGKASLVGACLIFIATAANAALNMAYTMSVEQSAANAAAAKNAALNMARRAAFENVLSRYAEPGAIESLSAELRDADILNLVGTMSIADERSSATAYSATVTIILDRTASERLLAEHNVPSYMSLYDDIGSRTPVFFHVSGLRNWAGMVRDLRAADAWSDLDVSISSIWGRQVSATVRAGQGERFKNSMRAAGWWVWEENGVLRASKH